MKSITIKKPTIRKLQQLFNKKIFAIPELQREFVWNPQKACDLLDSIHKNYPIGTMLVWETEKKNQHLLRLKLHILPRFDPSINKLIYFLVDGQQRLSVLYQIFRGNVINNSKGQQIDFSRIYFTINEDNNDDHSIFKYLRHSDPYIHIKLMDVLSSKWKYKLAKLPKYKMKQVEKCRSQIMNYRLPIIFVKTNFIEEVRETFIRVNSLGTQISSADRAFAHASLFKMRHLIREVQSDLKYGFSKLREEVFLRTIAILMGSKEFGDKELQFVTNRIERSEEAKNKFKKLWPKASISFKKAVDYLKNNLGLLDFKHLPSQNMVATLSIFFFYNNNAQPTSKQRKELKKWFWATGVGKRYTGGGYRKNILSDVAFFRRLGKNKKGKFIFKEKVSVYNIKLETYNQRSGITDAFFSLLALREPRYIEEGEKIPLGEISSSANKKNKHHIFPRKLLSNYGFSKEQYNSICNICFIVSQENQSFGSKKPARYLAPYMKRQHFAKVVRSHLMPHKKNGPLFTNNIKKGYREFLNERLKLICSAFEKEAKTKLFRWD